MDIHALREEYKKGQLRRKDLQDDPFKQFETWFQQACDAELLEPNAMTLATVSEQGQPFLRKSPCFDFIYLVTASATNPYYRHCRKSNYSRIIAIFYLSS
jgi:hypothetical protein